MVAGSALLTAALWAGTSSAASLDHLVKRGTFSLQQIERKTSRPFIAPVTLQKPYLKYGIDVPEVIRVAAEAQMADYQNQTGAYAPVGGQGSVVVKPVKGDVEYLVNVTVGNHNLALDLDTGSSDLWVFSTLQPNSQRQGRPVQRVYDPSGSNAVQIVGHTWNIKYGDMSGATGNVYRDTVTVGGVAVPNQAVEAASTVSKGFVTDTANDGLLGFAFSKLNTVKPTSQKTWFENAIPRLAQPVFTVALKKRAAGTYDFGYIDRAKYTGDLNYVTVNSNKGFWTFAPSHVAVGNNAAIPVTMNAIVDTGTSLWYLPRAATEEYWGKVPGAAFDQTHGGYTYPCGQTLPDIKITINGKQVKVAGSHLEYQQMGANTCFGGLQRDTGMPFSIFGDIFLKSVFTVFEQKPGSYPRLAFAQQA